MRKDRIKPVTMKFYDALQMDPSILKRKIAACDANDEIPDNSAFEINFSLIILKIVRFFLLGTLRQLIRRCCEIPLEDAGVGREPDGNFPEKYRKWCYADGKSICTSYEEPLHFLESCMSDEAWPG